MTTPVLKIRTMTPPPEVAAPVEAPVEPPAADNSTGMRSLQQIMDALAELDRLREMERRLVYYVTHMTEGTQNISMFETREAMVEYLRGIVGKQGRVGIFRGERWNLSKGPLKYLVSPDPKDHPIPLFGTSCGIEIDNEGTLGEDDDVPRDKVTIDITKTMAQPIVPDRVEKPAEEPVKPTVPEAPVTS